MSTALRLSLHFGGMFLVIGIMMPFWPVWLSAKGLSASEIGMVLAAGSVVRVFISPLIARFCDRLGERKRPIVALSLSAFLLFLPFALLDDFIAILMLQACFAGVLGPLMPLSDSLSMIGVRNHGIDYGRVRLWGSLTFIVGASGVGFFLKGADPGMIWTSIAVAILIAVLCSLLLPDLRTRAATKETAPLTHVLTDRTFLVFVAATACIQGSHALYYGFGTLNWLRMGLGEGVIGMLWAEGVIAEVILFVFAANAIRRIGPARLIALGGLACLIRWSLTAYAVDMPVIVLLQLLHAFTFGAAHLGAIHFIADRMPDEVSATAQTVYALLVSGLGIGLTSYLSGHLYGAYQGQAYLAMAGMGGIGMILAWSIRRRRNDP
ncbi:3-phenylpropionate MFS transporter [Thalassospiraceae bacterium LMO-JJ14]|nr:3-phenylpropionate MFS transporter [Thalassospiraceae bacterium LMO-JJ14]